MNSRKMLTQQGTIITEQANQLMNLVDDVLLFASNAKGIGYAKPRPLQVSDIVVSALRNTSGLLEKEGFTIKRWGPFPAWRGRFYRSNSQSAGTFRTPQ